jgi:hypothetical protein
MAVDPDGRFNPILARLILGAVIGGGLDIVSQLAKNGHNPNCINWDSVVDMAVLGAGLTGPVRFLGLGRELTFGKNLRIAPGGNRTGNSYGTWPHYHRRGVDAEGNSLPGQGIGRHRPWEPKSTDKRFLDRF